MRHEVVLGQEIIAGLTMIVHSLYTSMKTATNSESGSNDGGGGDEAFKSKCDHSTSTRQLKAEMASKQAADKVAKMEETKRVVQDFFDERRKTQKLQNEPGYLSVQEKAAAVSAAGFAGLSTAMQSAGDAIASGMCNMGQRPQAVEDSAFAVIFLSASSPPPPPPWMYLICAFLLLGRVRE